MNAAGYDKVPDKVKANNQQKMDEYKAQEENINKAIENFKSLM